MSCFFKVLKLLSLFFLLSTEWCLSRDICPDFENLSPSELSDMLRQFYGEIRKQDGSEYSKNALSGLRSAIHRHLTSAPWHRTVNIMHDITFKKANNVLLGILKIQKRAGKDKTRSFEPISSEDMKKLMGSEVFGVDEPQKLQDLVWFSLQFYLCRRGCEGTQQLQKDSFNFMPGQPEYVSLKFNEASKNHPGGFQNTNDPQRRLHATGGPLCPVAALKLYISKLNPHCNSLFQRVDANGGITGCWYLPAALGIKKLQKMMSRLSEAASLSRKYTNHCLRAACIKTLMDSGYDPITVTRLSGHRNVASVMSYCHDTTDAVKRQMGQSLTSALHGEETAAALPRPALASIPVRQPSSLELMPSSCLILCSAHTAG